MTECEATILSLETALIRPEVRSSAARIEELISESFFEFGCSGQVFHYHKGDILPCGPISDSDWEISDFSLMPLADGSVLTTYKAIKHTETDPQQKTTLRCSLWGKESGSWKIKFHQGTYMDEQPSL